MSEIFKERCLQKSYKTMLRLLDELDEALQRKGEDEAGLKRLLFGTDTLKPYAGQSDHSVCEGFDQKKASKETREARIFKCLFFKNVDDDGIIRHCEDCAFRGKHDYTTQGEYKIVEYQVPAYYSNGNGDIGGIGEIDLVLQQGEDKFAVEVKPPHGNQDSLLRMIAEILTYTLGFPEGKYHKAIGFFKDSYQYQRYFESREKYKVVKERIDRILKDEKITVFCFERDEEKRVCKICKLYGPES